MLTNVCNAGPALPQHWVNVACLPQNCWLYIFQSGGPFPGELEVCDWHKAFCIQKAQCQPNSCSSPGNSSAKTKPDPFSCSSLWLSIFPCFFAVCCICRLYGGLITFDADWFSCFSWCVFKQGTSCVSFHSCASWYMEGGVCTINFLCRNGRSAAS